MRACFRTAGLLLLAGSGLSAQCNAPDPRWQKPAPPQIKIQDVTFVNVTQLPWDAQQKIVVDLRDRKLAGAHWLDEVKERIRYAWQQQGYFKAEVEAEAEVLSGDEWHRDVLVTARVDEERQYKFGELQFLNNEPFPAEELGRLFPFRPGEVFNVDRVREGLEALRKFYAARGYINFTSVPETEIDEQAARINLRIDMDSGGVFRLRRFEVVGANETLKQSLLSAWALKPGNPYNPEYLQAYFQQQRMLFPENRDVDDLFCHKLDEKRQVVDLELNLADCECSRYLFESSQKADEENPPPDTQPTPPSPR